MFQMWYLDCGNLSFIWKIESCILSHQYKCTGDDYMCLLWNAILFSGSRYIYLTFKCPGLAILKVMGLIFHKMWKHPCHQFSLRWEGAARLSDQFENLLCKKH